ncbi:MAG TPA: DAK2 domain-containing protein [Solirubrobacteraceae bacterium]|nr:DAK2 domain-containing protein [Solirubrobacteraceae bacterium]
MSDFERFRTAVEGGLAQLDARRQEVNDLNVFPVADGDTGDNMVLTLRAVLAELDRLESTRRALDDIGRAEIVDSVARAALLGARGNSGVILSQLIRGAAEELISRPGELVDPALVAAAMARAADRAYGSVRDPAEGTILTVVREMAARLASELAHGGYRPLSPDTVPEDQDSALANILERGLETAQDSVRRGPDLLAALREAGVVDSGGYGLTLIVAGVVGALRGVDPPPVERHAAAVQPSHPQHDSSTYRYCTNFAVTGSDLDPGRHVRELEGLGDSVLVVGDSTTLKVHVHTDEPAWATALFDAVGAVSHLDVADMHEQMEARTERLAVRSNGSGASWPACGVLAVISGAGVRALYEDLGAVALDGGPTLNPSTYDLLAGIHAVPAEQVVVLPNSSNVFMAAERAAELSDKHVEVVRSRSQQGGLAAALALDPSRPAAANARAMGRAVALVRTGGVARAARDDGQGRFAAGEAVGYIGDELVAWGAPEATLGAVLATLSADAELVTLLAGEDPPLGDDVIRRLAPEGVELELSAGGQPSWWWLIAAE